MSAAYRFCSAAMAIALAGCVYSWRPSVPADMRTVAVPTFRNSTDVTELGAAVTRQVLREFQREGTFRIVRLDDAALEVQGVFTVPVSELRATSKATLPAAFGAIVDEVTA